MKITRSRPQTDFVIIPNAALSDPRLSWKACGLLAYLLSRPDGWAIDAERLARQGDHRGSGRGAVLLGLRELERAGYLLRQKVQGPDGRWRTEQAVYDRPQESPAGEQLELASVQVAPKAGKPTSVEPTPGLPDVGPPNVGPPSAKRQDGEQDGGGARSASPRPSPDATHGRRHDPGNPLNLACVRCRDEKAAATAQAEVDRKLRERDERLARQRSRPPLSAERDEAVSSRGAAAARAAKAAAAAARSAS